MSSNSIQTIREDDIAAITIDRPTEGNMLNAELLGELSAAFRRIGETDATIVVLRSTGQDFCRGRDVKGARSAPALAVRESVVRRSSTSMIQWQIRRNQLSTQSKGVRLVSIVRLRLPVTLRSRRIAPDFDCRSLKRTCHRR
jgi:enoyl-CoA hydratase/carnithine racemase